MIRGEEPDNLSLSCEICRKVGENTERREEKAPILKANNTFSVCLPILAWRFSQAFFEDLCKVTLTLKANRERHLRERPICLSEEPLGCLKPCAYHKLMGRLACGLAKEMGKMIRGEANLLGQCF